MESKFQDKDHPHIKWYFPKIKSGQLLAVPLSNGPKPTCAYFVKDISRQCEQVDYGSGWEKNYHCGRTSDDNV